MSLIFPVMTEVMIEVKIISDRGPIKGIEDNALLMEANLEV